MHFCIAALYYLIFKGSFNFYEVVDKKVINWHHVQNYIIICIFKLGDTITWDYLKWYLLSSRTKTSQHYDLTLAYSRWVCRVREFYIVNCLALLRYVWKTTVSNPQRSAPLNIYGYWNQGIMLVCPKVLLQHKCSWY